MTPLEDYRSRPSPVTPAAFSEYITGSSILYLYDPDPRAKRSYTVRQFWPEHAAALAERHYAPFWPLNRFHNGERKEQCFASTFAVGADVDCATTAAFKTITAQELDNRKNVVLLKLQTLDIEPHMVNETPKGLHIVFLIAQRDGPEGLRLFKEIMPLLVAYFDADNAAALVTQVLRFPNTLHQKNPQKPFLCNCLIDRLASPPYEPESLLKLLQERCPSLVPKRGIPRTRPIPIARNGIRAVSAAPVLLSPTRIRVPAKKWQAAMHGVGEGQRNAAAASVAGVLLRRYPRTDWQSCAWCAFCEWNECNSPPLKERELRSVFESIGRRVEGGYEPMPIPPRVRVRCAPLENRENFVTAFPTQP
ncbi:MAG: primase alpha helix C-terminal domain-containing protein [Patescibacteria group bacterium]